MTSLRIALAAVVFGLWSGTHNPARADDAFTSTKPVEWEYVECTSAADIDKLRDTRNLRVTDFRVISESCISAVLVKNEGDYHLKWWWYRDLTEQQVWQKVNENKARLEMFTANYVADPPRFHVLMVENPDNIGWSWYYGLSGDEIEKKVKKENARPIFLGAYDGNWWQGNGVTSHDVVMVDNVGKAQMGFWWYFNVTPTEIEGYLTKNKARVYSLRDYDLPNGTYDVVMVPARNTGWYWVHGEDSRYVLNLARKNNARIVSGAYSRGWTLLANGPWPSCTLGQRCCPGSICPGRAVCANEVSYGDSHGFGGGGVCKTPAPPANTGGGHSGTGNNGNTGNTGTGNAGCGGNGQKCCSGGQCQVGFNCDGAACRPVSTGNCGTPGSACCPPSSTSPTCNPGTYCIGNVCQPCGAKGQVCCHGINTAGGTCDIGLTCYGANCQ
jgi:hypothetical protein